MSDGNTYAILGCGGVGSNLAYLLTRANKKPTKMIFIDNDTVEEGNLTRQFFSIDDVGENKAKALSSMMKQICPSATYEAHDLKIETESDLGILAGVSALFVCTDNMESKRLVHYAKEKGIIHTMTYYVGCEEDEFEIKCGLGKSDLSTWSIESGYNSTQTAESNFAAAYMLALKTRSGFNSTSVKTKLDAFYSKMLKSNEPRIQFDGAVIKGDCKLEFYSPLIISATENYYDLGEVVTVKFESKEKLKRFVIESVKNSRFSLYDEAQDWTFGKDDIERYFREREEVEFNEANERNGQTPRSTQTRTQR